MGQENVELVRRIHDGWSRGDFSVGSDLMAEDFEWHQHEEAVEPGSHRGAAIGGAIRRIFEVLEDFRVEPEGYIDAGDKVVVIARNRGTGKGSGVELDQQFAYVWTVQLGKLADLQVYEDRREALQAAGVSEWRMSQENVEIVRRLAEGFKHRQHERAFELYDPEIEWDASGLADAYPDIAGVYHGYEGVRTYWRNWLSAWSDLDFEIQEVLDAGDDVVLLIHNQRQWGRSSGIEAEMPPYGMVFTIRGGKVVRWRIFPDQQSALEAAGLSD